VTPVSPLDFNQISLTAFLLTFIGGVVTGLNPCCYTMIPAIVGYLGGYSAPSVRRCSWLSVWFALGLATATALMGLIVVLAGGIFGAMPSMLKYTLALIPIVMGIHLIGLVKLKLPALYDWKPVRTGTFGAYLTGLLFSLVILPCATPVLASILSYAAQQHRTASGAALLFTYGAGIGTPLALIGTSFGLMSRLRLLNQWWSLINRISGVILIVLGFYLLWRV
jgi:cytochrome c biogenesis protein CcdA